MEPMLFILVEKSIVLEQKLKISILNQDKITSKDILDTLICHENDYEQLKQQVNLSGTVNSIYVNIQANQVYAGVSAANSEFISIPIPYDKGWRIEVNGEKTPIYSVNGGMLGFSVPQGYSEIKMIFIPQGFKIGVIASLSGFILILGLSLIEKKRKTN